MHATFNVQVEIDSSNITTKLDTEKISDMDTELLTSVLKCFSDLQKRLRNTTARYIGDTADAVAEPSDGVEKDVTETPDTESQPQPLQ